MATSDKLLDIGRNSLLGNRKKIAKFLMRTFTCRSTFLYVAGSPRLLEQKRTGSKYDKNEQLTLLILNANSHLAEEICGSVNLDI